MFLRPIITSIASIDRDGLYSYSVLLGRCVQEGSTIFLTEIPDDYIKIKSGLGQDNPKILLIVPIRLTEIIIGVIEIASLEIIHDFQIEFVERIGSTIASSQPSATPGN